MSTMVTQCVPLLVLTMTGINIMTNFLIVIFVILLVAFAPIASIEAVNLLFGTNIPITLTTWLASFWLTLVFAPKSVSK